MPHIAMPGAGETNKERADLFENRVWLDQSEGAAEGEFLAFLSDGTLVTTNCGAPYRLSPWRWVDEGTVVWQEDSRNVRADVVLVGDGDMALVVDPDGANEGRQYKAAQSPVVCRDR